MPILVFFLALMGIVTAGWMWRNVRYSILVIFIIAAILTPTTDILNMCIFRRAHGRALHAEHRDGLAGASHAAAGAAGSEKRNDVKTSVKCARPVSAVLVYSGVAAAAGAHRLQSAESPRMRRKRPNALDDPAQPWRTPALRPPTCGPTAIH